MQLYCVDFACSLPELFFIPHHLLTHLLLHDAHRICILCVCVCAHVGVRVQPHLIFMLWMCKRHADVV